MSDGARPRRTRVAIAVCAVIGAVALAGCGAGQVTQTARQVAAVDGASADVGPIAVRNAVISYPEHQEPGDPAYAAGGAAPLSMVIANGGPVADRLVSASSRFAAAATITGDAKVAGGRALTIEGGAPATTHPAGAEATTTPAATPTQGAPDEGEHGEHATGPTTATATPAGAAEPGHEGEAGAEGVSVVLTGLTEDIEAGRSYAVDLVFEKAGAVTVQIPVANPTEHAQD